MIRATLWSCWVALILFGGAVLYGLAVVPEMSA
jgi:hypothetical protein